MYELLNTIDSLKFKHPDTNNDISLSEFLEYIKSLPLSHEDILSTFEKCKNTLYDVEKETITEIDKNIQALEYDHVDNNPLIESKKNMFKARNEYFKATMKYMYTQIDIELQKFINNN